MFLIGLEPACNASPRPSCKVLSRIKTTALQIAWVGEQHSLPPAPPPLPSPPSRGLLLCGWTARVRAAVEGQILVWGRRKLCFCSSASANTSHRTMFLRLCHGTGEAVCLSVCVCVNVRKAVREQEEEFSSTDSFYVTTVGVCYVTSSLISSTAFDLLCFVFVRPELHRVVRTL